MSTEQKEQFNPQELAKIGVEFIGKKTIKQVCDETSLSRSIVSRILNGSLKNPLTVRTIYRFSNGNSNVAKEMLSACGYPEELYEKLYKPQEYQEKSNSETKHNNETITPILQKSAGLNAIFPMLEKENKGRTVNISYDFDGSFIARLSDKRTVAGVPAFISTDEDPYDVLLDTIERLKEALNKTKNKSNNVYIFFTNSGEMFDIIFKELPNLYYDMWVMQINENGICRKQQIKPLSKTVRNGGEQRTLQVRENT